ncbi:LysM peptidoglycan-binding domain-containing protein [Ureibacillus sp. FSL K6-0165]|jgi:colicin import membrane protein|uniref:LysM peptidoglycan-binding domain-containing protein n=1 Tax=Ureibacillus sp. FSL K6-0165 TaxID=2954606 RepID=UPI0030F729E4
MSKNDYRKKIEEHRQSIEIKDSNTRLSRSERRRKKKKSKETPLLTTLTVILIGIPLAILIYVWGFWNPGDNEEVAVDKDENLIEVQRNNAVAASNKDEKDKADENKEKESSSEATEKEVKKDSEAKSSEKEPITDSSHKQTEKDDSSKKNENSPPQQHEKQKENVKVHTVSANENLFRIAKQYYSDPMSGVEKIKAANNLSSDIISPGQSLVIPE